MLKRSPGAEPIVLGLLIDCPQHGYSLYRRIQSDLGDVWTIGMNRLYALLDAMEAGALITGRREKAGLRPAKRVYSATAEGRRLFQDWLQAPVTRMRDMRLDFLPKLYFARRQAAGAPAGLIAAQRAACQAALNRMIGLQQERGSDDRYLFLVYEFRIRQARSMLAWLDQCDQAMAAFHGDTHDANQSPDAPARRHRARLPAGRRSAGRLPPGQPAAG
jgi:DNA-binding PadR family transcriptional regulator